ncbi:MAG TPA: bifunctional methylenetetrahydrofolate dehydrogenase/methenyltetrahydrofolate cyclohydrolase FolD [Acidimicrobiia bacterium]|nr:bifunctional methylenetetrahydrofolate dehydrogenase/methenyltetrahydrofolate cyclohydrolase FolD [Acidimicrobiia bacterium]
MSATLLDGKLVAAAVKAEVALGVKKLGRSPGLATVLIGEDPASQVYVRGKRRDAEEVGMVSIHHHLPASISQAEIETLIDSLNNDPAVDGILVQLPLPGDLDGESAVRAIDPSKDADGLHPFNLGLLVLDQPGPRPCTPSGVMRILDHYGISVAGATAVVVGRSFLVGRPLALMLSSRGTDATVTVAHSRTRNLAEVTRQADIVVAAVGVPRMITAAHVKPGATVIDVGINRLDDDRLVGDVDFDGVEKLAEAITPVPGGVGPMTRAMLLVNTLAAAERRARSK